MCALLLAVAAWLLPSTHGEWGRAMCAEMDDVPPPDRARFVRGCVRALLWKAVELRLRGWLAQPAMLLGVFALGVGIALLDRASDARTLLWISLLGVSALAGWFNPVAPWRWGILLGVGVPLLSLIDPGNGPYAIDRADARYGLLPAIAVACIAAFLRRRTRTLPLLLAVIPGLIEAQSRPGLTAADLGRFADSMFADYLRLSPEPSLAFVVVHRDSILFARGYGSEDPGGTRPVDPHTTVFWMGSVSKLLTADAARREIDRGRLTLGTSVGSVLGWPLPSRGGWREITLRDLLTHTSGLDEPFMAGSVDRLKDLVPLAEYLRSVRWRAARAPGDILRYSNHGMALAGLLVERVSGVPFAEYVEREILRPLGMQHSSFRQPASPGLFGGLATAGTDARADFLLPSPAGSMVSTAADMGRFLIAQMDTAGPRSASLRSMQATQWRGHPSVPGIASGWFETALGGVAALHHTGARHHFSVAWISPRHQVGVFLVHSMRQGGPFQSLRTDVIRELVRRYLPADAGLVAPRASHGIAGVYRPLLLSTTTVERLGYLFLDTRVQVDPDGRLTLHAPGELGVVRAVPIGEGVFEVHDGPQAGLRIGFVAGSSPPRMVLGGTLLDPVMMERLSWWQRGQVHAVALGGAALVLTLTGMFNGIRVLFRRNRTPDGVTLLVMTVGAGFILALITFVLAVLTNPEAGAAAHMRAGLHGVLAWLTVAFAGCVALPMAILLRRGRAGASRTASAVLALAAVAAAVLLWRYRLVGFQL